MIQSSTIPEHIVNTIFEIIICFGSLIDLKVLKGVPVGFQSTRKTFKLLERVLKVFFKK